jgi:hypothetical protein
MHIVFDVTGEFLVVVFRSLLILPDAHSIHHQDTRRALAPTRGSLTNISLSNNVGKLLRLVERPPFLVCLRHMANTTATVPFNQECVTCVLSFFPNLLISDSPNRLPWGPDFAALPRPAANASASAPSRGAFTRPIHDTPPFKPGTRTSGHSLSHRPSVLDSILCPIRA